VQRDRAERVVELGRLGHPGRRDHVDRLRHGCGARRGPGVPPRDVFETLKARKRESAFAEIETVPRVAPLESMYRWPKPCTWISRLHADAAAIVALRDAFAAWVEVGAGPGDAHADVDDLCAECAARSCARVACPPATPSEAGAPSTIRSRRRQRSFHDVRGQDS
jgi:hypothetical protein